MKPEDDNVGGVRGAYDEIKDDFKDFAFLVIAFMAACFSFGFILGRLSV